MIEIICSHEIEYSWRDGKERPLDEIDIEHIQELLKENYIEGELCQYDNKKEKEYYGWWKIYR